MNENAIMLTVIIITYNQENSIAKALDSVLEQETTYPYVIWICEDCSTDSTLLICDDYAKRYPDKIKLFAQSVNTFSDPSKVFHSDIAIRNVDTKYYCILEGDDAWCDTQKIQIALNVLENNPEYVTFAHDTLCIDVENKTKRSQVHEIHRIEIQNPLVFENAPYLHTSARIHRNVIKYSEKTKIHGDIYLFYNYLDKGPLYYYDKIMSVYNITGKGVWSGLSASVMERLAVIDNYQLNKYFNYKYDEYFTRRARNPKTLLMLKRIFSKNMAWEFWFFLKFLEDALWKIKAKYFRP
jgi:glycosyltransferase involved in cell wall biosynthesis